MLVHLVVVSIDCAAHQHLLCVAGESNTVKAAHLFMQRTLYKINRLVLFW